MPRTIKRYESRKLYDSKESRYVSLQEIAAWIRDGQEIEVIDNATDEVVTGQTLAQIILDEGRSGRGRLSPELLHDLVRASGEKISSGVNQVQKGLHRLVQASFDRLGPVKEAREEMSALRQRLDTLEKTLANLEDGRAKKPGEPEDEQGRTYRGGIKMTANADAEPTGATGDTTLGPSALKKLYLATLGAGVVIREESGKLFEHLVERGTPLEEPVRQHVASAREKIDRDVTRAAKAVNRAVDRVVTRYSNPKEKEIAELTVAADRLEERMKQL